MDDSVTKQESVPNANDSLIMSGAATSVCRQSLADRGLGVELSSATGHRFTTTGNTTICLRTRDGVNVASDFQIARKNDQCQIKGTRNSATKRGSTALGDASVEPPPSIQFALFSFNLSWFKWLLGWKKEWLCHDFVFQSFWLWIQNFDGIVFPRKI